MSFNAYLGHTGPAATVHLAGDLADGDVPVLRDLLDEALRGEPGQLLLDMAELRSLSTGGVRCIAFVQQRLPARVRILLSGAGDAVVASLARGGMDTTVTLLHSGGPREQTPT